MKVLARLRAAQDHPIAAEDRAELIRLIIHTLCQHTHADPNLLARSVVEEMEAKGWRVTPPSPPSLSPKPSPPDPPLPLV
jgi:hypothetical protein